jgi:hypothetical protein
MGNATTDQTEDNKIRFAPDEALRGWTAILLSLLIVCLTASLFGAGQAYREGYLYQFGFDLAQLPADFHDTLYWGFIGGTPLVVVWLIATLIVLLGGGLFLWIAKALWKRTANRWQSLLRRRSSVASPRQRGGTHVQLILGAFLVLPVLYLLILVRFGVAEFYELGAKQGKLQIAALRADPGAASAKHGRQWIEISFHSPSESFVRGYRLLCTDKLCAIYDPDPKVRDVRLVFLDNVREIRIADERRR